MSSSLVVLLHWSIPLTAEDAPGDDSRSNDGAVGPELSLRSIDLPDLSLDGPADTDEEYDAYDDRDGDFVAYEDAYGSMELEKSLARTEYGSRDGGPYRGGEVVQWHIPDLETFEPVEREWPKWILDGRDLYQDEVPHYAVGSELPLFYIQPRTETRLGRKLKRVVRKRLYKELRKQIKRRWKRQFRSSPSMTYAQYAETVQKINYIGRDSKRIDDFNSDHRARETRDEVFRRRSDEGEAEIPLLTLGPLTITDTGSLRFDFGQAASKDRPFDVVAVGGKKPKPLFKNKHYRVRSGIKLRLDPLDHRPGGNFAPFLDSYGFEVEVDWLSDVLKRNMLTTEVSVQFDNRGDVAAFFNLVIKARS